MEIPVLFLIFNRPDIASRVFEVIRTVRPRRLYVAADGPRHNQAGDIEKCSEARKVATSVDWPCDVKTLFRSENAGCRLSVSTAIDWFFDNEEAGIILEDDCIPHPSFFPFVEAMLERYRTDERIMCVSAQHFHGTAHKLNDSYFFSRYNHCWGWGSWRRAWALYDRHMTKWPDLRETDFLLKLGDGSKMFEHYWKGCFDRAFQNKVDSWAYRWTLSCWEHNGLTVLPSVNLVRNVGFDNAATHTKKEKAIIKNLPLQEMVFPLIHPGQVLRDVWADTWEDRHVYGITPMTSFIRMVLNGLGK